LAGELILKYVKLFCRHHHQIVEQHHNAALTETEERTAGQVNHFIFLYNFCAPHRRHDLICGIMIGIAALLCPASAPKVNLIPTVL